MDFIQPDRIVAMHAIDIARRDRIGLAVVLNKLGVVAMVRELRAHLLVVVEPRVARTRTMEDDDCGEGSGAGRNTMMLLDRLAGGLELARRPIGVAGRPQRYREKQRD